MISILGVHFTHITERDAVSRCVEYMEGSVPRMVITAGPEFVMAVRNRPEARPALDAADMITADGIGAVIASRWYGRPLPERVAGADLVQHLLEHAARRGLRVYVLGASPASHAGALANLRGSMPDLAVSGHHGYFAQDELVAILEDIERFRPHLLLVGLGQPRQELFIAQHKERLRVPLAIGVGGAIDIISGAAKRAPALVRRAKLEWLHRLLREPHRFRRQLALPRFALAAWKEARSQKPAGLQKEGS